MAKSPQLGPWEIFLPGKTSRFANDFSGIEHFCLIIGPAYRFRDAFHTFVPLTSTKTQHYTVAIPQSDVHCGSTGIGLTNISYALCGMIYTARFDSFDQTRYVGHLDGSRHHEILDAIADRLGIS
jgi:hypothetical protein